MKRLVLIVVVVALALTLVPLALAGAPGGGGWKYGHVKFTAVGAVAGAPVISTDLLVASTIKITVKAGSHIKGIRGDKVFDVAGGANVWQLTEDGKVESSLDKLAEGDKVMIKGTIARPENGPKVYTITSVKYLDRTPATEPTLEPATPPAAQ